MTYQNIVAALIHAQHLSPSELEEARQLVAQLTAELNSRTPFTPPELSCRLEYSKTEIFGYWNLDAMLALKGFTRATIPPGYYVITDGQTWNIKQEPAQ